MINYRRFLLLPLVIGSLITIPSCSKKIEAQTIEPIVETVELSESFAVNYNQLVKGIVIVGNYIKGISGKLGLNSYGTGFIFKEDDNYYYFLTNRHVVKGAEELRITLWTKQEKVVTLLGTALTMDFAVFRIEKSEYPEAYVLPLGDTSLFANPEVGDTIYTIGNPYTTSLYNTLCRGVVSGINRVVSNTNHPLSLQSHAIQIDATINSGNSGGPLLNEKGEVIGINTLGLTSDKIKIQTLKFALPIHDAYLAANKIIDSYSDGGVIKVLGGFTPAEISESNVYTSMLYVDYFTREKYGIPVTQGVYVKSQSSDSVLGIQDHSIIVGLDGYNIKDVVELRRIIYAHEPGDSIELKYYEFNGQGYDELKTKMITLIKYGG